MRIKAKWLRYTLEVFEPLYKSKLTAEIQTLKNFQDVLGGMHDCDVWIDSISKIADKSVDESKVVKKSIIKAGSKQALNRFLLYLIENKKSHYEHFVQLWADTNVSNFFNTLRETAGDEIALGISSVLDELNSKRALKMAVLADIHANLHALEAVVQDAEKRGADVFLNAGDSIGLGAFPNEVLELLYSKNCISVIGNFDLKIANNNSESEKEVAVEFAKKELEDFYKCYLLSFPSKVFLEVAGKKLLMVHGSPKSIEEHVYHDTPVKVLEDFAVDTNADLIIVGHSHEQFERKVNNTTFVNPGSVGRPDDGNPQAAYALLSFSPFKIELIRLSYNVKAAADALRRKRLPEIYAQMLLRGLSVENVIQEDKAKRAEFVRDNQKMVKTILKQ
jgi:putative phosphoesterase